MDNSGHRLHEVFFYGLYMDPEILTSKEVTPRNPRIATVKGYKLRIGKLATLLRDENSKASGIIYSLTHDEIDKLYKDSGFLAYVPESLTATTKDNATLSVLCCNLRVPPATGENNPEYLEKLTACMKKYNVPIF
ncbi:gamma-glutamylcyclotransferase family protein [Sulfurospirillum halorespirans]|uniref:Gamma-glutamylcyclotransferase AIG2-like domain-containing protein n=1 Tax=Sulfurospirillum halorespirans DSM 13726 TaxID=1193502 RepID=A0A1D7TGX4_9BACT|nr:gamma-glutamylcyclotransferase family protein [Sulfurospirillum halorespirans]AOO64243.1 hypothetical protein SHALO_0447 [Sulfurospirillum halorespirans DSM 13726]